MVVAV
ncbi:unnamed protein product, partial [Adineta steineri]|jgi:hypothetical protein